MASVDENAMKRIEALLAAHGADPARWPEAERERLAGALMAPEVAPLRREAAALDALLDRATIPQVPAGAVGRLMARVADEAQAGNVVRLPEAHRRFFRSRPQGFFPAVSALAASLLIGLYLGASGLGERLLLQDSAVDETFEVTELDDDLVGRATGFLEEDEAP